MHYLGLIPELFFRKLIQITGERKERDLFFNLGFVTDQIHCSCVDVLSGHKKGARASLGAIWGGGESCLLQQQQCVIN